MSTGLGLYLHTFCEFQLKNRTEIEFIPGESCFIRVNTRTVKK